MNQRAKEKANKELEQARKIAKREMEIPDS